MEQLSFSEVWPSQQPFEWIFRLAYILHIMLKGSTLLKENLCIYKCFIDVLYLSDRVFKTYWEMVVPISPDILLKASSCLCPTCFKQLCLHLCCCVILSCCHKGRVWASSLRRSFWFHCSLLPCFGDKRPSSSAAQQWFCVVLGHSVSTVFHIPTLCHPFFFILPFLKFCHVFKCLASSNWPWWLLRWCI